MLSGSGAAKEGFAALGLNADEMAAKFAAGGESAQQAFDQTVQALAGMSDPIAQNAAGAALFGSAWEEMGPGVVDQLAAIEEEAYASSDALNQMQELEFDDFGSLMEEMQRSVDLLLVPLGETLIPILSQLIEAVSYTHLDVYKRQRMVDRAGRTRGVLLCNRRHPKRRDGGQRRQGHYPARIKRVIVGRTHTAGGRR